MSSRTVSIRLSSEMIQDIDEKCNTDGCCRNDFVKKAIETALEYKKSVAELQNMRVSYDDGKTWVNLENS